MDKSTNHNPAADERQTVPGDKIVLVGMMGSGKSTLGRLLASRVGCRFIDIDSVIEAEAGRRIAEIFREEGEAGFRQREFETTKRLVEEPGALVLGAGGGAFCQARVRDALRGRARSVFLRVAANDLVERLARADVAERPMLGGTAWRERVAELVRDRYPHYETAELRLDIDGDEEVHATADRLYRLVSGTA